MLTLEQRVHLWRVPCRRAFVSPYLFMCACNNAGLLTIKYLSVLFAPVRCLPAGRRQGMPVVHCQADVDHFAGMLQMSGPLSPTASPHSYAHLAAQHFPGSPSSVASGAQAPAILHEKCFKQSTVSYWVILFVRLMPGKRPKAHTCS